MDRRRRSDGLGPKSTQSFSVLSQPLGNRREVSFSAYALLFSEIVQYSRKRVRSTTGLEEKLNDIGRRVGSRALELVSIREKVPTRSTKVLQILSFVFNPVWKFLFGKQPENLRKVSESESSYFIEERDPLVNTFVSVPEDYGSMNCAAFVAGIIAGVLESAGFTAKVHAYNSNDSERTYPPMTLYTIEFSDEVMQASSRECWNPQDL
eukprot:CAMPEP_0184751962 /NCGR_PEP_ID=MMETSP0315-20130426/43331_1 /TAXON_ID=101924 /ORGANISM="Rhodosorus marinus, Strain UTEX LB 2760" /LENGTH=207 /DNA_ID=CAMNT_0027231269 /DNA_START=75 /DNA_END=698 /DNA_ORIENTATION=+